MTEHFDPQRFANGGQNPPHRAPSSFSAPAALSATPICLPIRNAGFPVAGLYDPNAEKARELAETWGIRAFASEDEALAVKDAIFDLATPPATHAAILSQLPFGAAVLIQKPMGSDLAAATEILAICRARQLKAAVNFQLRFAPMMLALKDAVERGFLGEIVDFDAWLALATPWGLWPFLKGLPRIEIAMHSIHYLDFIRGMLGNPLGVHAKTIGHPNHDVAQTRTAAILDYGDRLRCVLSVNHDHDFGRKFQACEFRISGTKGAAYIKLGVNLDYPRGEPDELWIARPVGTNGSPCRCKAHGFRMPLPIAWPTCSALPPARTTF
jgi:predicted dehydrogenase